jgi:hypothetical protein
MFDILIGIDQGQLWRSRARSKDPASWRKRLAVNSNGVIIDIR